jgi:hypothetical protein
MVAGFDTPNGKSLFASFSSEKEGSFLEAIECRLIGLTLEVFVQRFAERRLGWRGVGEQGHAGAEFQVVRGAEYGVR